MTTTGEASQKRFDAIKIREDFPILRQEVHGRRLVYLDSAATSQKPQAVIDALISFYANDNSNVHRGVHLLSERATRSYEEAREKVRRFLNANHSREIVFTRGTTEAINLVAGSYGRSRFQTGDEIVISAMEHHSNIVPWQILCQEKGARLRIAPMNDDGELLLDRLESLLNDRTKLISVCHVSNALGTINPIRRIIGMAHDRGVPVLIDGAQAVPHLKVDVRELDCDFYTFSSHKVYGPTGVGVLYGKAGLLDEMPPYQSGGDMIKSVRFEETVYNDLPYKFEAGTPNIAGAIGLGAAIDYLTGIGVEQAAAHEAALLTSATESISRIPGIRLIGTARDKAAVLTFVLEGIHAHDLGTILDREGIAVRTGHHCAQPVMDHFGVPATARASFAVYNSNQDVDALLQGLEKVREVFC